MVPMDNLFTNVFYNHDLWILWGSHCGGFRVFSILIDSAAQFHLNLYCFYRFPILSTNERIIPAVINENSMYRLQFPKMILKIIKNIPGITYVKDFRVSVQYN